MHNNIVERYDLSNARNNNCSWYLVYTKPKSELKAQENLNRQGYKTYLPMVERNRRRYGKNLKTTEAFFFRYLFINLDHEHDNWAPINSTIGVAQLIRFGSLPAVVPEKLIKSLKQNEDDAGFQQVENEKLKLGKNVEIINGPFSGHQGICQQLKSSERVVLLLDIVGKNTQVTLSMNDLQIA